MIALAIVSGVVVTVVTSLNFHLSAVERNRDKVVATFSGQREVRGDEALWPAKEYEGRV